MAATRYIHLRQELLDRRRRLEEATAARAAAPQITRLLEEVDAALNRFEKGTFGLCETCHEDIEQDRLLIDPLVVNCIDHLTTLERRALENDLELASRVQGGMLPERDLNTGAWEVAFHYEPAGTVSGDYCDVLPPRDPAGDLLVLLGDVSGKGVAASMLMTGLRAIIRTLMESPPSLPMLAERANRLFCESTLPSHYATLALVRAGRDGSVEVCNAGHPAPIVARDSELLTLEATGLPLGLFCNGQYPVRRIDLRRGDTMLLYSDGLIEARDRLEAEYGPDRLAGVVRRGRAASARGLVDACLEDLARFRGTSPRTDDLTVMALRRL